MSVTEEVVEKLIEVEISQLIRFADSFAGVEVHLPVSGKFVKLNFSQDHFVDILRKLQQKDVHKVFIKDNDFKSLVSKAQDHLSPKSFYDPKSVQEERVEKLDASLKVAKNVIHQLGVNSETVQLLKTVNERSMQVLSESPSIFAFVKRFKKNCSEEFLHSMLTSYVMSLVIDQFPWKSDAVKEKGALASLLCDMLLDKGDFETLRSWEKSGLKGELPDHIKRHPHEVAEKLRQRRNLIPSETITIIEQHHERPDGRGFPFGENTPKFNQLSAIFIISQRFIEELFEENFDYEKRFEIINRIQKIYSTKNFEKALDALIVVVS